RAMARTSRPELRAARFAEYLPRAGPLGGPGADHATLVVVVDRPGTHAVAGLERRPGVDDSTRQHLRGERSAAVLAADGHFGRPRRVDHCGALHDRGSPPALGFGAIDAAGSEIGRASCRERW